MTDLEMKRVAVAKDALAQVMSGICVASPGTYLYRKAGARSCHVCALGALFVGAITESVCELPDSAQFHGIAGMAVGADEREIVDGLSPIWSKDELEACLLYTSDAADERSSVDLG